jgi:transcriptional regulator with XRE-family HTH domain
METQKDYQLRLKQVLEEKGIKPLDLALWMGVSPNNVYAWVNGRSTPSFASLCRIADELNITLDELRTKQ